MAEYFEGERYRVRGQVHFKRGHHYSGYNTACRVELLPALGNKVDSSESRPLRYITYQDNVWYLHFAQHGYYYQIPQPIHTELIATYVDTSAFLWRQQITNALWVMHPLNMLVDHKPNEPFFFPRDYDYETETFTQIELGYVYIVYADTLGTVRIGWTSRPDRRPIQLSPSTPAPLNYLALLPGTKDDEQQLQHKFSHLHLHGSWYRYTKEMHDFVVWSRDHWRPAGSDPMNILRGVPLPIGSSGIIE